MVDHDSPSNDEKSIPARRGRVDSVNLYEVKEEELELLEKGPSTLKLNFAIFLFSIAFACITALATSNFKWQIVKLIFAIVSVVGILQGAYLIISWWRARTPIAKVVSTIRNRINGNSVAPQMQDEPETQPKDPENDEEPHG